MFQTTNQIMSGYMTIQFTHLNSSAHCKKMMSPLIIFMIPRVRTGFSRDRIDPCSGSLSSVMKLDSAVAEMEDSSDRFSEMASLLIQSWQSRNVEIYCSIS